MPDLTPPESFLILSRLQSGTESVCRLDEAMAYTQAAVLLEREECAKVCEGLSYLLEDSAAYASAIRNRSARMTATTTPTDGRTE